MKHKRIEPKFMQQLIGLYTFFFYIYTHFVNIVFRPDESPYYPHEESSESKTEIDEWHTASHIMNGMIYNTGVLPDATMARA